MQNHQYRFVHSRDPNGADRVLFGLRHRQRGGVRLCAFGAILWLNVK